MPIQLNATMRGPITNQNFMNRPMGQPGLMNRPAQIMGKQYKPSVTTGGIGYMNNPLGPKPKSPTNLGNPRASIPPPRGQMKSAGPAKPTGQGTFSPLNTTTWPQKAQNLMFGAPPKKETPTQRKQRELEFQDWLRKNPSTPGRLPPTVPGKFRDFMHKGQPAWMQNVYAQTGGGPSLNQLATQYGPALRGLIG